MMRSLHGPQDPIKKGKRDVEVGRLHKFRIVMNRMVAHEGSYEAHAPKKALLRYVVEEMGALIGHHVET